MKKLIPFILLICMLTGCSLKKDAKLKWWQDTIVYEIYPSSFKDTNGDGFGDLNGIISELDYLKKLGVGAIWLTPVYGSPMGDNGYDVSDYYSINPRYGTMDDMDRLIKEAKKRNIKIVMDLVFNHTSDEMQWFKESKQNSTNEKSDWYIWRDAKPDGSVPNNWRGIFGGSAWTYCEERNQYYLHTFADFQPDLNWENPEVRNALYDIANFWADKGVGGFRVDAVTYIKKPSDLKDGVVDGIDGLSGIHAMTANTYGILDFLHEFKDRVAKGRDIFMVGEANGVSVEELTDWVGTDGVFDMIFQFDHLGIQVDEWNWTNVKDFKLTQLKKAFTRAQVITKDNGWNPIFLENHDQPRCVTHFIKNCMDYKNGAKILGMLNLTLRGTPFLYQGQEIGMSNISWDDIKMFNDIACINQYNQALENGFTPEEALPLIRQFSRDNARTPMQWSDEVNAGFSKGNPWLFVNSNYRTINVQAEQKEKDSILNWYIELIKLRKKYSVFSDGTFNELLSDDENIFAYVRENEKEKVVVLLNFTDTTVEYDTNAIGDGKILISNLHHQEGRLLPYECVCKYLNKR